VNRHNTGFTLVELIVVIAIIGILAAIAYPSYQQYLVKTRRADAMAVLQQFGNAMERQYMSRNSYLGAGTCNSSGGVANSACAPAASIFPSQAPLDGSRRYYDLTILDTVTATAYRLRATPIAGTTQATDGIIELDSTGVRYWDNNNDGDTTDTDENNWEEE